MTAANPHAYYNPVSNGQPSAGPLGRVLVVDDSEDDHLQIERLLRKEARIFRAYTANEAIERLSREPFDALISDQKMPRMTGDELIRRIKAEARTQGLRCILLSGRTSNEHLVDILRSGDIFRYFEKNRTLLTADGKAELTLAVRNAVQASRLERERSELNERLRSKVDALSSQYHLMRALLTQKDPSAMLQQVVSSLLGRMRCDFVIGFIDLRPSQGHHAAIALAPGMRQLGQQTLDAWRQHALKTYARLSGRPVDADLDFALDPSRLIDGAQGPAPTPDSPVVPVFVNRDLRGLLVIGRADGLPGDEAELLGIWRDQLQDALTRVHNTVLDAQHRVELMIETMTEGVVLTDERGVVTLMNPVARRMLNLPDGAQPDFAVVLGAMGLSTLDVLRRIGVGRSTAEWFEQSLRNETWQVLFAPVRDHTTRFVGILTVIRDVTTEKVASRRREEFLHIITHELRGPLTSISGVLDLLGRHILGEMNLRQTEYVELAKGACTKINRLLDDLLDLAKFEQGKMPLSVAPIHLERVISGVVDGMRPAAMERGLELAFDCVVDSLICRADANRVGQVVVNLLTNAFKYTPTGQTVTVSVLTTFTAPDLYLVAVHNPGEEIPEGDLHRIFEKFEQVGERRGGTGLGLAVCRNIVEGHGGRIWVESGRGEGTTFVFSLPEDGAGVERPGGPRLDERDVLVIGRDRTESWALAALLASQGHRPSVCAATPEAVRDRLTTAMPAIAVYLDVEGMLDPSVLAELNNAQQLPVLAVLPPGRRPVAPVDGLLEVPPDPSLLASILRVVIARNRLRRRLRVLIIASDDDDLAALVTGLEEAQYLAYAATSADQGQRWIVNLLPDLVVLDPAVGDVEGLLTLCAEQDVPVQWWDAAHPGGLARSAPLDAMLAQVRQRMVETQGSSNTLVVLPGAREMQREVSARLRERQPFAYCAIDIVGLKDGVEAAGFMWGHQAMAHTATVVHDVLSEHADGRAFLGHERDDDFVFLVAPEHIEAVSRELVRAFAALGPVISARGAPRLKLSITAIVDSGQFGRFNALRAALGRARHRDTGETICIQRPPTD